MRKKSRRYGKRRGGSFFTKKICIDFPKNRTTDMTYFGKDRDSGNKIPVSKSDLEQIIEDGTKKSAKYHFFRRNFSSKKGVCMSPSEFDEALKLYKKHPGDDHGAELNEHDMQKIENKLKTPIVKKEEITQQQKKEDALQSFKIENIEEVRHENKEFMKKYGLPFEKGGKKRSKRFR